MRSLEIPLVVAAVASAWWFCQGQPWTPARIAGLIISLPCLLLWVVARVQLGSSFAVRAKAKQLVTHGLYSKIRNPIYVFGTSFFAGFMLLIGHPGWAAVAVVLAPMQVIRARKEARVLEEKFGEEYRRYRSKTWF